MSQDLARGHLTSREISRWLVEGPSVEAEAHLQRCWTCQAKLAEARQPLTAFRSAVLAWSNNQPPRSGRAALKSSFGVGRWLPAAGLALAAVLLAGFLLGGSVLHHPSPGTQASGQLAVSDAALMDQVDSEVSEAVPDAMAPLTDLVAWDLSEASTSSPASERRPVRKKTANGLNAKANIAD